MPRITYTVRIGSGRKRAVESVRGGKRWLESQGFTFKPSSASCGHYEKKNCPARESARLLRWASRRGLWCERVDSRYTRSSDYRRNFFAENPPLSGGKYRCAYCGRKFYKENITVDHIFPVHLMERDAGLRATARLFGIRGTNDVNNLCAACMRCNTRKGTKTGTWALRGLLGRHEPWWKARRIVIAAVIMILIILAVMISRA